jgi:hypothetical protein
MSAIGKHGDYPLPKVRKVNGEWSYVAGGCLEPVVAQLRQEYSNANIGVTIGSVASAAGQEQASGVCPRTGLQRARQGLDRAGGWLSLAFLPRCVGPLHLDVVPATSH